MANNNTIQPVATPPQTGGMKSAASLAGNATNAAYMKARGAKPVSSLGVSAGPKNPNPGGLGTDPGGAGDGGGHPTPPKHPPGVAPAGQAAKARRMTGVPTGRTPPNANANAAMRRKGPKFSSSNAVPTGGRNVGVALKPKFGGNIGGPRPPISTMDRAKEFMKARQSAGNVVGQGVAKPAPGKPGGVANMQTGAKPMPKPGITPKPAVMPAGAGPKPGAGGGGGNVVGPGKNRNPAKVM